jgi:protein O-GlcNAc transferase
MPDSQQQADDFCRQGNALYRSGQIEAAISAYQQAIAIKPDYGEVYSNLGNALLSLGRIDQAIAACSQAAQLRPQEMRAHNNLGNALLTARQLPEAIAAFRRAIELAPNVHEPVYNLGNALREQGDFDQAIAMYQKAISLRPDVAASYNNLASVLKDTGQIDQALRYYDQALSQQPNDSAVHSGLLYSLYFHPSQDRAKLQQEHNRWSKIHAEPLRKEISPHLNDRNPNRRLRIGYVSPDFRDHCQSLFTIPLLSRHDHQNFEIFCYSSVLRTDTLTDRIKKFADVWRTATGLPDAQLAQLIRNDQIDILIDLTMHMSGGRPLLFAQKPAPIQVAWLAYPGTTGLQTIDYRLTDSHLDPEFQNDQYYSEKSVRLPHSFWCYDPLTDQPKVNALPAKSDGFITFGCLNNFAKVHDGLLEIWSKVLKAIPHSKFLLMVPQGSTRENLPQKLGIEKSRLEFVAFRPRNQYLQTYQKIDLGLDTFPVNGHTTSLDSLWMGVPVVSLHGQTAISRAGLSQMTNLGLEKQFVADTPEKFIQLAVNWANDLQKLDELRATLRHRLQQSPLMNAKLFAQDLESAYRKMWQRYCQSLPPESFNVAEKP